MIEQFAQWIGFYLVPAALAFFLTKKIKSFKVRLVIVHIGLILSIVLLSLAGASLHLGFQIYAFIGLLISIAVALFLLGRLGAVYVVSSIIQESCMLLSAVLLSNAVGIYWAAIASALVYALAHLMDTKHWQLKIPIVFCWGIASILLYDFIQQPMLNFAIHIIGGAILIRSGLMYANMERAYEGKR